MNSVDKQNPILSVLMQSDELSEISALVDILSGIQTQLSEIQENQRNIMKALRDIRLEQRNRLSDLKASTQSMMKLSHISLSDQLSDIQDYVDDQDSRLGNGIEDDFEGFLKNNSHN